MGQILSETGTSQVLRGICEILIEVKNQVIFMQLQTPGKMISFGIF
jgi:hypothetical protein